MGLGIPSGTSCMAGFESEICAVVRALIEALRVLPRRPTHREAWSATVVWDRSKTIGAIMSEKDVFPHRCEKT